MTKLLAAAILVLINVPATPGRADSVDACLVCHPSKSNPVAEAGVTGIPTLAGQHPEYIVRQLERFAAASEDDPFRRRNIAMSHVGDTLPKSEWQRVATALAEQECAFLGDPDPPSVEPNPCAVCHGARGLSDNPEIPNLAGQDLRYMFYQYQKLREPYLPDFPGFERPKTVTRLHPVMGPISAHLHDRVVAALIFYSKLPCR